MPLRVLIISHPAVAPAYRRKFELIGASRDVALRLIVPEAWPEEARSVRFDATTAPEWARALPIVYEGYYTRYFYRRGLRDAFREFRPDIVHVEEEPYSLSAGQALWMTHRHAPNARFIFRSSISTDIRLKAVALPFLRAIERAVFRRADCAFVLSRRTEDVMRVHGYRGPARVFPNGVDVRIFRPLDARRRAMLREALGLDRTFVVGFVGRLVALKGVETILEAVQAMPDVRVLIVGEGDHRAALEAFARSCHMAERVRFMGAQPPERVAELLNAMDVFVLPSRTSPLWVEFFGRVAVEAMACGVPVIGSSSGEIPATIGDAGVIFPEGNAEALGKSIRQIAQDDGIRAALRARGIERVRTHFAWEAVADKTLMAYQEIAAGARR